MSSRPSIHLAPPVGADSRPRLRGMALILRGRSGLTQRQLAAGLGVSARAVQKWEAGQASPSAEHLKALITLYRRRAVFAAGREVEEATALWEALQYGTTLRIAPFDHAWFDALSDCETPADGEGGIAAGPRVRQDWGEAPAVGGFVGRESELSTLARWLLADRCRLVAVLGLGGIGKTSLTARLARELAPQFEALCWRSLRNAPPVEEWLAAAIHAIAPTQAALPTDATGLLSLLLELLRTRRSLLVLDNLETVLQQGVPTATYREGYEGYGEVLRQLGESGHQSCLLITSREQPPELGPLAGERSPVRALRLEGLGLEAGRALLEDRRLVGDAGAWRDLVGRYGGNVLALKVAGQAVAELFGGEISAFLGYVGAESGAVFGDIRRLLDRQFDRLSALERSLAYWLAMEREPVAAAVLMSELAPAPRPGEGLEALQALWRRSLLERATDSADLTLQPVVLEYVTDRLVAEVVREIVAGRPQLLVSHALVQAMAKDYVRRSQERLIALPLLAHLSAACGGKKEAQRRLQDLLERWRGTEHAGQGYGPGNVVSLLRLLRGDLRGQDLSRLVIKHAYLQEVEMQDASLAGAHLEHAVLAQPFDSVMSVALDAQGEYLAAGTMGGEVWSWRAADRALLWYHQGHAGGTHRVTLSPDGRLLASGGADGTVRLWAADSGEPLAVLTDHSGAVWGVALSGDGQLLASGGADGTAHLWATEGGECLAILQAHTGVVWGVALSGDGRLLATGGADGAVRLWAAEGGECLEVLTGHSGAVWGVALSGDGRLLASGGADGTARLWAAEGGECLAVLRDHTGGVYAIALSGDGRLLATGGGDGTVRLWATEGGECLAVLQAHTGVVWGVALSAERKLLLTGGVDGTARLWAAQGGERLAVLQGHPSVVKGLSLSGDGRLLATGGGDGTVRLWAAQGGECLAVLRGHSGAVWGVALNEDGRLLASGGVDGAVRLWATEVGGCLAVLTGHTGIIWGVALGRGGQVVASGGGDGDVRLWAAEGGECLAVLRGHSGAVWGVALSGDGRLLTSCGADGTIRLWATEDGECLAVLRGHVGGVYSVALSRDGRLLASGGGGAVRLWATEDGECLAALRGHAGVVYGVALSGDGRLLASNGGDGTVRLWAVESGECLAVLQGDTGVVRGVALSGDGQFLAGIRADGFIQLRDLVTATDLRTLRPDRLYERLDITGLTGITAAQRAALVTLGSVERA